MARVSKIFSRKIAALDHFVAYLRALGFHGAGAVAHECEPPTLTVNYEAANGDPTAAVTAYHDPDYLEVLYAKPLGGADGIPEARADGSDVHTVTLRRMRGDTKQPRGSGSEVLRMVGHFPIKVSPLPVALVSGVATVTVGPVEMLGEWDFDISDPSGQVLGTKIHLRFM